MVNRIVESPEQQTVEVTNIMMPKPDTIDAILRLNAGAEPDYLAEFSADELDQYLRRLVAVCRPAPTTEQARPSRTKRALTASPGKEKESRAMW